MRARPPDAGLRYRGWMATVLLTAGEVAAELQLDLDTFAPGPIAGVAGVGAGPHHVSARAGATWHHHWLHVPEEGAFVTLPVLGTGALPAGRGTVGAIARTRTATRTQWSALTANLARAAMRSGERLGPTRGGRTREPLAALERAFLDGFLTPDAGDLAAIATWRSSLGAIGGARAADLERDPGLYCEAVRVIERQVGLVGADVLDDALVYELDLLARELVASGSVELVRAGELLGTVVSR